MSKKYDNLICNVRSWRYRFLSLITTLKQLFLMHDKFVSVIIPSYNHEAFIEACIDSVLEQTHKNLELIVIDDGSKDSSLKILERYKNLDSRVRFFSQENVGAHNTINRAIGLAQGDFVSILNSDDIYKKNRLEKALEVFSRNADIQLISSWIDVIDTDGNFVALKKGWETLQPWAVPDFDKSYSKTDDFELNLFMNNFVATTSNIIFRKSALDCLDGKWMRDLRFCHDWDFLIRFAQHHKCHLIKESLMEYRVHKTNTISSNRRWMIFEVCWVIACHLEYFGENKLFNFQNEQVMVDDVVSLFNSTNFQRNDKLVWILNSLFVAARGKGVYSYEEFVLGNEKLRNTFISFVED